MRQGVSFILFIFLLISVTGLAQGPECLKSYQLSPRVPISFGLEVEFDLTRNPKIIEDYRAENISEKKWMSFSYEEKRHHILNKSKFMNLVKMSTAPQWLPQELWRENSGNFELTDVVFQNYSDWKRALEESKKRYGIGAAQAHIVYNPIKVSGSLTGFVAFSGDLAQVSILEKGYQKYLQDFNKIPGNNLAHSVLGPMSGEGINSTQKFENKIRASSKIINETGGKYFLSTVLRGGIYGNKSLVGFELRQFNFDYQSLDVEVKNTLDLINKNLFEKFRPYEKFSETYQQIIARLHNEYDHKDLLWIANLERASLKNKNFYLNIVFLFKDWKSHPILKTLPMEDQLRVRTNIVEKEGQLISEMNQVLQQQNLSEKEVQKLIRVLVAKYFYELNLSNFFKNEYQRILLSARSYSSAS